LRYFVEKEDKKEKLYDKRVTKFLISYILRYKKYLFISLFLVLIITSISLLVPYVSKIIIDRYIIKEGNIINTNNIKENLTGYSFILKKIKSGKKLDKNSIFLFRDQLKYFSKKEITYYTFQNIFSKERYLYIKNPKLTDKSLNIKIDNLIRDKKAYKYDNNVYLINIENRKIFTLNDTISLRQNDFLMIFYISITMLVLLTLQFFTVYMQIISLIKLSNKSMKDLRVDLFERMVSYEISFFDKNPIGRLVNRITNDVEVLRELFSNVIITLFQDFVLLIAILIVMFRENLYMASGIAITFPFIIAIIIIFRLKTKKLYLIVREKVAIMNSFLQEMISQIKIIQIFVAENKIFNKFKNNNTELYTSYINQVLVRAVFLPILSFFRWFAVGLVIYLGAKGILSHKISFGLLVLFLQYVQTLFRPLTDFAEKFDMIISANAAGEKILTIFEEKSKIEKDKKSILKKFENSENKLNGKIKFQNVWFSYKKDQWVLKDINFKINSGETIAIIGETGTGKTTIISLLSKLYEIQRGKILINNHDINDIPYNILRKNISLVMQDVFLFSKTIKENIILNNEFDRERFDFAIKATHIDKFINKYHEKEEKMVAERGSTFSAGERQLLSFARALYFNPSILILDEATSNIDSETEKLIQDAIKNLIKGRTSIIIAHRLSTIENADNIIVLDKGKIVESGTHNELISNKGIYYNLYSLQFADM
jgi:ABC-type multidrug transport system fused ATPase/permease subunit